MTKRATISATIIHNILWSKYKGEVFSAIYAQAPQFAVNVDFLQIAETERARMALNPVDRSFHRYPYTLLFSGAYEDTSLLKRTAKLMAIALRLRTEIVVLPGYHAVEYWAMLAVLKLRRIPTMVTCDSTINDQPQTLIKSLAKRVFFAGCIGFLCYGQRSKEYLVAHGANEANIFERCQAAASPEWYSEEFAFAMAEQYKRSDVLSLVYIGRLSHEKGIPCLLNAVKVLIDRGNKVDLKIIGNGPIQNELSTLAETLGLTANVWFQGAMGLEDIYRAYGTASMLVLPSLSEPWGLVVNEALSMGCPVVVSDKCGCVPEMVIDRVTGVKFKAGDIQDLVQAILQCGVQFADRTKFATQAVLHMRNYTPKVAAQQVIEGIRSSHQRFLTEN